MMLKHINALKESVIGPELQDSADEQQKDTIDNEAEPVSNISKDKDGRHDQNQGQQCEEIAKPKKDWTKEIPQLRGK